MSFPANNNNRFFLVDQTGPFYPNSTYHPAAPGSQHQFLLVDQSGPYAPNSTYHPAAPGPEHQFYLQSRVNGAMARTIPNSTYHPAPGQAYNVPHSPGMIPFVPLSPVSHAARPTVTIYSPAIDSPAAVTTNKVTAACDTPLAPFQAQTTTSSNTE